ncbi:MAG TPA: hypothetical protein VKN36_11505 [Eudoraea sp.]|nr:hypothetical protein [Eudoraea sp.]
MYTHTITKEDWESRIRDINIKIPGMTDLEVIGAFMKLVAAIGDGHTILYPAFQGPYAFTFIPLEFYFFGEDLFVRGAEANYKDLVGSRVLKIGKLPVSEVIRESSRFLGRDNEMQLK